MSKENEVYEWAIEDVAIMVSLVRDGTLTIDQLIVDANAGDYAIRQQVWDAYWQVKGGGGGHSGSTFSYVCRMAVHELQIR